MPQIPTYQERRILEPGSPVQISGTGDARIPGENIAQLGQGLAQFGKVLADAEIQTSRVEAQNEIDTIYSDALMQAERTGSADGSDYTKIVKDFAKERLSQNQEKFNKFGVADWASQYQKRVEQNAMEQGTRRAFTRQETNLVNRWGDIISSVADRARTNPELAGVELKGLLNEHLAKLRDSGVLTPESYTKVSEAAKKRISEQYVEGMLLQQRYGALSKQLSATEQDTQLQVDAQMASQLGIPEGTKLNLVAERGGELSAEESELMRALPPEQKDNYLRRLQAEMRENARVNIGMAKDQVNAISYFAMNGRTVSPEEFAKAEGLLAKLPPEARSGLKEQLTMAKTLGPVAQNIARLPLEEVPAALVQARNAFVGSGGNIVDQMEKEKSMAAFESSVQRMLQTKIQDPAMFLSQQNQNLSNLYLATRDGNPQSTQTYALTMSEAQKAQGLPSDMVKLLPVQEASRVGQALEAAQRMDVGVMNEQLKGLQAQWGEYFPQVLGEIRAQNKTLGDEVMIAAGLPNENSRLRILSTMKNKKVYEEAYKATNDADANLLHGNLQDPFGEVRVALSNIGQGPGTASVYSSFFEAAKLEAKRLVVEGKSLKEASDIATNTIFRDNFAQIESFKSSVLVPKHPQYQMDKIENFVNSYGNFYANDFSARMKKLGIEVPPDKDVSKIKEQWRQEVRWVTTPDLAGVTLYRIKPDGSRQRILDKSGKPVSRSFLDISKDLDPLVVKGD